MDLGRGPDRSPPIRIRRGLERAGGFRRRLGEAASVSGGPGGREGGTAAAASPSAMPRLSSIAISSNNSDVTASTRSAVRFHSTRDVSRTRSGTTWTNAFILGLRLEIFSK